MIKTLTKIGNSQGIIFDSAIMDMARLSVGDAVDVIVHDTGSITLTPVRAVITPEVAAERARALIKINSEVFRRLS
jgi:antitoxin component of MazEF toxin-antitoxin module